ncbi:MAG: methyltransferase domain-containing protein [Phycisphaerales bacterium]|nr:methyltransferase domain-containing protein [Phycisphaerales bacterium]
MSTAAVQPAPSPAAAAAHHYRHTAEWLRDRLVDRCAQECAARGFRRIALYGAGLHTRAFARQPWAYRGVRVCAILDDFSMAPHIAGVPVCRPDALGEAVDAVVISSDSHEAALFTRAQAHFAPRGVPVLRIYGDAPERLPPEQTAERLVAEHGLSPDDAAWLADNRAERHDATLPMLPPARTELHLRRYELAADVARSIGARAAADAACGTGYGSALLADAAGLAHVTGVDIDPRTTAYAARRHARPGVTRFVTADAAATGLPAASFDLIASFETVEHVGDPGALLREHRRLLRPGGRLVISTPHDAGLTEFHLHSFTLADFSALVGREFAEFELLGQRAGNEPRTPDLPPGIFRLADGCPHAEYLIAVARG